MTRRGLIVCSFLLCLAACSGIQTPLGNSGADDSSFIRLFVTFLVVCTVMYLLVVGALAGALANRRRLLTVEEGTHHGAAAVWLLYRWLSTEGGRALHIH